MLLNRSQETKKENALHPRSLSSIKLRSQEALCLQKIPKNRKIYLHDETPNRKRKNIKRFSTRNNKQTLNLFTVWSSLFRYYMKCLQRDYFDGRIRLGSQYVVLINYAHRNLLRKRLYSKIGGCNNFLYSDSWPDFLHIASDCTHLFT